MIVSGVYLIDIVEFFDFIGLLADTRDFDKYDEIAKTVQSSVGDNGLNLLINNAGVTSKVAKLSATRKNELMDNLEVNTVAPIMLTKVNILHIFAI
jgi:short-subunit dehydrogenase involved in D-alanine esterification of teichoic acids